MKAKVCFIGLGVMGFPMAGHLADAGYEVTVFNRTTEKSGINMKKVMATIGKGAAGSWQMENRAETMIEGKFDFGFALKWMRKDLAFCE